MTIFLFGTRCINGHAQIASDTVAWRQSLLNEIRANDAIVDSYLTHGKKADSLFRHLPIDTAINYFKDSSYPVKYYSFFRIMELNDSLAFEYMKAHITDSTSILHESSCMNATEHFNELIGADYKTFIQYKYAGLSFTMKGHGYIAQQPNHRKRKKLMKAVDQLFLNNGLKPPKVY